jgi:hypothetical protein
MALICPLKLGDEPRSRRIERAGATLATRATRPKKAFMVDREEMDPAIGFGGKEIVF